MQPALRAWLLDEGPHLLEGCSSQDGAQKGVDHLCGVGWGELGHSLVVVER